MSCWCGLLWWRCCLIVEGIGGLSVTPGRRGTCHSSGTTDRGESCSLPSLWSAVFDLFFCNIISKVSPLSHCTKCWCSFTTSTFFYIFFFHRGFRLFFLPFSLEPFNVSLDCIIVIYLRSLYEKFWHFLPSRCWLHYSTLFMQILHKHVRIGWTWVNSVLIGHSFVQTCWYRMNMRISSVARTFFSSIQCR